MNPTGESDSDAVRLGFDRCVMLQFRLLSPAVRVQPVLATSNAVLCVPATCTALTAGTTCSSPSWALPGQGLTHIFSSGRGLCNARGLRVSGDGADQIRDPATGQSGSAQSRIGYLLTRPVGRPPQPCCAGSMPISAIRPEPRPSRAGLSPRSSGIPENFIPASASS